MEDVTAASQSLLELRALGVGIGIDDFGTGYSSLAYLKQLPVNMLKIDRSFVAGLAVDDQDRAVVGAVIAMAEALGLAVVAEGIESVEVLDALVRLGCRLGQGYLLGRPGPLEAIDVRLAATSD
jgi:EAL domain-containing protein (putative c-di-GMP-specific phosphodiesterase class I)